MKPSSEKQKSPLRIAIIVAAILALLALAFFVFFPRNESKPVNTVVSKKDATPVKTIVKEEPAVLEDSIKWNKDSIRRKMDRKYERNREGYAKEQARFAKVLKEASDEELFVVLNYAIANHFVPNRDIDPYYDIHVMVGCWKRSLMVYNNLSGRKDLLRKIYPDLDVLDEYVNWGRHGEPYPDTNVSKAIMDNAERKCQGMDDMLVSKYFGTPLMRD